MKKILSFSLYLLVITNFFSQEKEKLTEKANLAFDKGEFKDCIKYVDKALLIDAADFGLHELKGLSLLELEEFQQAYDYFNLLVDKFPQNPLSYHARGNFFLSINETESSIEDFTTSNELTENDSLKQMNMVNISTAYLRNRRFKEAYAILIKCLENNPNELGAYINISLVCGEMRKFDEAITYLNRGLEISPDFPALLLNLGFTYQKMEQHEKAFQYFNRVLELTPDDPYAYNNRGYCHLKLGRLKEAMQDVDNSIKLNKHNSYAYRNKALIYIEKKELDKACENIQIAVQKGFVTSYGYEILELQNEYCLGKNR